MRWLRFLAVVAVVLWPTLYAQRVPSAISVDPAIDKAHPAGFETFQLPSHGEKLNAIFYVASGAGPHPVVVLLHGFPGNERNLDLAQAMRRAGFNVLFFNYRGSWGSAGAYSLTHCMEDAEAAVTYLREPANAARLRSDAKRIVLIGHSMGGLVAANVGARDAGIRAVATISSANLSDRAYAAIVAGHGEYAVAPVAKGLEAEGLAPLAGCTPESVAQDWVEHAVKWNLPDLAPLLAGRPTLVITSDDGRAPASDALVANLRGRHAAVTSVHLATDHVYSDQRIALETAVLNWLAGLPG